MTRTLTLAAAAAVVAALPAIGQPARSQPDERGSTALAEMVRTEQRFAARALVIGWKPAFLEYFADTAIGFDGERIANAKDQLRTQPDPPKGSQLLWEPRYGDIAASGELGYLTGPVRSINPARDSGRPRPLLYASIWKRQADGTFKVALDMGIAVPMPAAFAAGFTRAPHGDVYGGTSTGAAATRSLRDTDAALTNAARGGQADAYRGHLADGARLHRSAVMPVVGQDAILAWLGTQPAYTAGESRFAEAALSGDLGYTYGTYTVGNPAEHGFYVRAWTRGRDGVWRVALDVLQPQ
jgi:ketosteroid isomerase-like protein